VNACARARERVPSRASAQATEMTSSRTLRGARPRMPASRPRRQQFCSVRDARDVLRVPPQMQQRLRRPLPIKGLALRLSARPAARWAASCAGQDYGRAGRAATWKRYQLPTVGSRRVASSGRVRALRLYYSPLSTGQHGCTVTVTDTVRTVSLAECQWAWSQPTGQCARRSRTADGRTVTVRARAEAFQDSHQPNWPRSQAQRPAAAADTPMGDA
jgi:hypothetical protein